MALTNYTDLESAIASWLGRSDLSAVIADFVTMAEARFNNTIRTREMETSTDLTLSSGAASLPSDFLEAKRVTYKSSPRRVLTYATPDWLDEAYPDQPSADSQFYQIVGSTLTTMPMGSSDVELVYYQKIPGLESNSTNWLMTRAPSVYLYGSLIEAAAYNQDVEGAAYYAQLLTHAVNELQSAEHMNRGGVYSRRAAGPSP